MGSPRLLWVRSAVPPVMLFVILFAVLLNASDKKDALQYGVGLMANIPASESEVVKAVDEVVQNGAIRGTKEFSKDEYVKGAISVSSSNAFPAWTEGGKVFYKVKEHALDPRSFKDTNDVGTLAVRYIVMGQDQNHTVIRIDAVFTEEFRHKVHPSDGSVENAEYKLIHDYVESMQSMKNQAAEAEREKQEANQRKFEVSGGAPLPSVADSPAEEKSLPKTNEMMDPASESSSIEDLKKRVHELQQQTARRVKGSGAPLKSAPFHTAASLQTLGAGAEVLIVISTPYWYGVETHEGQHGWILKDDLEELP